MRRKKLLLCSLILLCVATPSYAQLWSGILDPSRAVNWGAGYQGVEGGIPNRTTICSTFNPGATAAQINSAIAACPSGQVVFLNAGTYNLTTGFTFEGTSHVTLRGAGGDQTYLVFTGHQGCLGAPSAVLCLKGSSNVYAQVATTVGNWTAGYAKGTTQITLSSVAGLSVGQIIILDQCNDGRSGASCTGTEADRYPDVWVCGVIDICSIQGSLTGDPVYDVRMQQQMVKITAINGNVLTISPSIYMPNWRASQSPRAWTWGSISQTAMGNGVENLSIDFRNAGSQAGASVINAYGNWIKGVRFIGPAARTHVWILQAARTEIRDNYFYGSGGASTSYGVELFHSDDALIINNIFHHIVAPILSGAGTGNIVAYNYMLDMVRADSPNAMGPAMSFHDGGVALNLYEGNQVTSMIADTFHGNSNFVTLFRNQASGADTVNTPAANFCTQPVSIWSFHRFYNVIGNVLGQLGYHTTYESTPPTASSQTAIYNLGHKDACGNTTNPPDDRHVKETLLRWGNYDVVTLANRFNSSEVPTGLTKYANAVPGSQTLPASFFLSARPAWFVVRGQSVVWPPIGPEVTGGNLLGLAGHANKIPARLCYDLSLGDGANLFKRFNATTCYASSSGDTQLPNPPRNLRVQ